MVGIDTKIEMIEEQVVVGAIGSVFAAQNVGVGGFGDLRRGGPRGGWRRRLRGKLSDSMREEKENTERPIAKNNVKH